MTCFYCSESKPDMQIYVQILGSFSQVHQVSLKIFYAIPTNIFGGK